MFQEIQAAETREREKIETICELENKILAQESVINQLKVVYKYIFSFFTAAANID